MLRSRIHLSFHEFTVGPEMKLRKIPSMLNFLVRSRAVQLFVRTFMKWQQDECLEMGAALSYYALFSLFPIFLVIWSIVARVAPIVICNNAIGSILADFCSSFPDPSEALLQFAKNSLPEEAFNIFDGTVNQLRQDSRGASIIGFILLFISASNVFGALDRSVQKMWHVHKHRQGNQNFFSTILRFLLNKVLAFSLVLGTAALMIMSLLSKIAIGVIEKLLEDVDSKIGFIQIENIDLISGVQFGASILTLMIVIMILFKILPSTRITWRDVFPGAVFTVTVFMVLQHLVSNSIISIGSRFRSYGVIGGVMVLMFWIYLVCQIFFMGNAFTYVYTHLFGSRRHKTLKE